ncbi:MAG: hypothetical protein A2W00_14545 [Candidatus Eisenbacteria bacterium RBG_16_71_46]|nr:MAG: hypothetical protein A2W00_14545 [Candidatus Eisenbacteria bacterium RBG_16_71_46]
MSARTAVLWTVLALPLLLLVPAHALAGAWIPAPGESYSELRTGAFTADGYHDLDGARAPLPGGGLSEQRSLAARNEFGWKPRMSFFLTLPAVSVTRRTGNGAFERTETGLGDAVLGVRRLIAGGGRSALAIELGWKAPLGYDGDLSPHDSRGRALAVTGDTASHAVPGVAQLAPTLGAGQQDLMGTLNFGTALAGFGFIEVGAGYRYRTQAPADQAIGAADLGLWLGPSLLVGGRYRGEMAVGDGDTPADKIDLHLVGPLLLYRVDDHIDLMVGSLHTASAKNALHIDEVYVSLAVRHTRLHRLQGFLGDKRSR